MPEFSYTPQTQNAKSVLTPGLHPAFLIAIKDQATPSYFTRMAEKNPRCWAWYFATWEADALIERQAPELLIQYTSQTFNPGGGQYSASKAYKWTQQLLAREIAPGESVNLDPLLPLACRVVTERNKEYSNVAYLMPWPDGAAKLTPYMKDALVGLVEHPPQAAPATPPPGYMPTNQGYTPPPAPVQPGLQSWATRQAIPVGDAPPF